jgi:hypothetical protein
VEPLWARKITVRAAQAAARAWAVTERQNTVFADPSQSAMVVSIFQNLNGRACSEPHSIFVRKCGPKWFRLRRGLGDSAVGSAGLETRGVPTHSLRSAHKSLARLGFGRMVAESRYAVPGRGPNAPQQEGRGDMVDDSPRCRRAQ